MASVAVKQTGVRDLEVIITKPLLIASTPKMLVSEFTECSFYEGEGSAKLDTKRYQLRSARAGGNGYSFVQDFEDAQSALDAGKKAQRSAALAQACIGCLIFPTWFQLSKGKA